MLLGTVEGNIWSTKKSPGLLGHPLQLVSTEGGQLVAVDLVGAGVGDKVLLSFGSAARMENPHAPADAAIVGILDQLEELESYVHQ